MKGHVHIHVLPPHAFTVCTVVTSPFTFYVAKTSQTALFFHVYVIAHCIKAITVHLHHLKKANIATVL